MGQYRLIKQERLSGKKQIEKIFREGNSFFIKPFRVIWMPYDQGSMRAPVRMMITVPAKNIRRAVKRNLIKRRVREAYRKHKNILTEWLAGKNRSLDVVFIYTGTQISLYRDIEEKLVLSLQKIVAENEKATD